MESSEQTGAYIFSPICINKLIFGKEVFPHLVLSEYANQSPHQSNNFTNLNFCDVTLLYNQSLIIASTDRRDTTDLDSEDDYRTGCRKVSHCQQQSYSGLHSPTNLK